MAGETYKFSTGLKSLDGVLQGLIQGDNVVWQTDDIGDYKSLLFPFCRNAIAEGKPLVYFRFASHPPLIPRGIMAHTYELDPDIGFARFVSEIIGIIEKYGKGACYVFDCLSDLAVEWFSDRMLGNFFMLVCPYLYDYDTVTYFVLTHDRHMPTAVDAIHSTAQVVIDVFVNNGRQYILPIKVINRHSPTLYMLHSREGDEFQPVTKSAVLSEIMSDVNHPWIDFNIDRRDLWTRKLIEAQEIYDSIRIKRHSPEYAESLKKMLIKMIVTRDDELSELCEKYFDIANIICIGKRMIGTGLVGGKATGMLLARIILKKTDPKWQKRLETHDSFYIGSDVFCTYIIKNKCWWDIRKLKAESPDFASAEQVRQKIMDGSFPDEIVEQFREMLLGYFGQSPVIVRSSSILEDAYGNAFSGKYESVFCANQGPPEERLNNFIDAVKTVYASTYSRDALSYRAHWKLLDEKDEEMAILVQRVSGSVYGDIYFPHIAGVAYSFNPFVWNKKIEPSSGALRLVFGLGTRAVENHGNDYTRIVALNEPLLRPETSSDEVRSHSQHLVDILDLKQNMHVSVDFEEVANSAESLPIEVFASRDTEMEQRAREMNLKNVFSWVLTFENLLTRTDFTAEMREILETVEAAYKYPVDIEFTVNFIGGGEYRINVLQCRPFQCSKKLVHIKEPDAIPPGNIIIKTDGPIIGENLEGNISRLIYVIPEKYVELSEQDKYRVGRVVGEISNKDPEKKIMVAGPGRWGTKMPSLGVPVSFTEIRNVTVLCEIAMMHEGLNPDISFGTHFFNDLVETGTIYVAVCPASRETVLNRNLIFETPNIISEILPSLPPQLAKAVYVVDSDNIKIYVNILEQKCILFKG